MSSVFNPQNWNGVAQRLKEVAHKEAEEVEHELDELRKLKGIVKKLYYSPVDSAEEDVSYKALVKWIRKNP